MEEVNIKRKVLAVRGQHPVIEFSCPTKSKATLSIQKSNDGFSFLEVATSSGILPNILSGKYSREVEAEKAIRAYFRNLKPTATVRRDEFAAERAKRKAKEQ